MLGLAPSEHLSQTGAATILQQLLDKEVIKRPIFSLLMISAHEGVLSVGGTAASAVDHVVAETRKNLDRISAAEQAKGKKLVVEDGAKLRKRARKPSVGESPWETEWEKDWAWSHCEGAEGYWQILMQAAWMGGTRVLKNQAVIIDVGPFRLNNLVSNAMLMKCKVNTPFVMAPPLAAKRFYASLSGSYQLPPPHSNFYVFPCLNPPKAAFEFGGKKFPFMHSPRGQFGDWHGGLPGGRFSLGRLRPGSGYCVGAVVETRMGLNDESEELLDAGRRGTRVGADKSQLGGNGMRDLWVIGEGFFRGVGATFDVSVMAPMKSRVRTDEEAVQRKASGLSSVLMRYERQHERNCPCTELTTLKDGC